MRSITLKLIAAFLIIGLVSILVVVLIAQWNTSQEFNKFVSTRNTEELTTRLTDYYVSHGGSWDGIGETIQKSSDHQSPNPDDPQGLPAPDNDFRFVLTDANGVVVVGGPPHLQPGDQASENDLKNSTPLKVDDQVVGYLLLGGTPFDRNPLESAFIRQIN
ncbi:MAG: hypothetical protein AB1649_33175, partial [Chloroflexota bacterium]